MLDNIKNVLILGGTGTLGVSLLRRFSNENINVKVLSRDEHKHYKLKKMFPYVEFVLGDIRDKHSIHKHFKNIDAIFHVAALKHIDILEENPIESIKTNILGTINACECAIDHNVKYFMFSSTDKACDPINLYGHCKAISEKLILNYNKKALTVFSVYRWGNVINSNGSALPFFIDCIKNGKTIPLTHQNMSRFFITIEQAIEYILRTFWIGVNEVLVHPDMKAARIDTVIDVIGELLGITPKIEITGLRPGEKIDECLYSKYSGHFIDSKICEQYSRDELKILIRPML